MMTQKYSRPSGAYASTSNPNNATKYQADSSAVPKVAISSAKVDGDFNYLIDAVNELDEASGSRSSIDERLSVSLNPDGTLKGSVVATIDEWTELQGTANLTRVNATTFRLASDHTSLFTAGKRVRLNENGRFVFADVTESTFANGTTDVACTDMVNASGAATIFTNNPSAVFYSAATVGATGNSQTDFSELKVRNTSPIVRVKDTSGSEFGLRSANNKLEFVQNTASEDTPVWDVMTEISASGFSVGNGSVGLSQLANGTSGELLSWNSSGQPTAISTGQVGEVLTSQGSSDAPIFTNLLPSGMTVPFAGASVPVGWLLCDGSEVSRSTYAALFAAVGTTYGAGNGATTFTLPDLRGRTVFGLDTMGGTAANTLTGAGTLGQTGGSETASGSTDGHTLIVDELPSHSHGINYNNSASSGGANALANGDFTTVNTYAAGTAIENTGGDQPHSHTVNGLSVVNPFMALNYIIKT